MISPSGTVRLSRPLPILDEVSAGFWGAASRGELAIQRCTQCRRYQHPPRAVCPECGAAGQVFERVSGRATLFSWSINRHSVLQGFDDAAPYLCILVELVEQPGLILASDYAGETVEQSTLRLGAPMRVTFMRTSDPLITLPQFRPDTGGGVSS
jgi:uncharacterized OB-fold protein